MAEAAQRIYKLKGKIKHYDWGGCDFIPQLLGIRNEEKEPFAEYWMGAHPAAPSEIIVEQKNTDLLTAIAENPELLGKESGNKFSNFPFLLKIMDVKQMLSIQVHPSKSQAVKGFEQEENNNVPIHSTKRNYKDDNHKPEMIVALSDFWLLHGFKPESLLLETIHQQQAFAFLENIFTTSGYKGLYEAVMQLSQSRVNEILLPLVNSILSSNETYQPEQPEFWIKRLYENSPVEDPDRGIFSMYLFNIVKLNPGEGIFQGAGLPHAYLEGQGVELMANSDNVLRGGLTSKHIDVEELLKLIRYEATIPRIIHGEEKEMEKLYPVPVDDFALQIVSIKRNETYSHSSSSPEICFLFSGDISEAINNIDLKKGEAFYILPQTDYRITAFKDALIYKAFIP